MKKFVKEYTVEFIAGGVVLIGIFLILERYTVTAAILSILLKVINPILSVLKRILEGIGYRVGIMTPSDALGGLLVVLALAFIVWRVRYRFHTSQHWASNVCPKCSSPVTRVHRTWWDRILGATFFPEARRYRCTSLKCTWSGLRRRHIRHRSRHSEQVSESGNP
jgi:hypothetical protein